MIRSLPKKLSELGRIRLGDKDEKRHYPRKLEHFRLTSSNKPLLHFAANCPAIGGEVREWKDAPGDGQQWELYTACNQLAVLIPTFSAISVQYEIWSGGGCQRRCDGEWVTHSAGEAVLVGAGCVCPLDDHERAEAAKTGKACARILRLNVILPDLPGMGVWRLESKGYYATAELLGTLEMLQMAGQEHQIIEGVLRLEQRTVKRPGQGEGKGTLKFAVPVLWPTYTPRQLLTTAAAQGHLLMAPGRFLDQPSEAAKSWEQHSADLYGGSAATIPPGPTRMAQDETLPPGEGGETPQANLGAPGGPKPPPMDPTAFAYAMEKIWTGMGLTTAEMQTTWAKMQERCGSPIPAKWYDVLLNEQRQWAAKRGQRQAGTLLEAAAGVEEESS